MNIIVKFFASVRETVGCAQEELSLPAEVATLAQLRQYLARRGGAWEDALGTQRTLRMAYQQVISDGDTALSEACEVAFFPPMTGG